MRKRVGFGFDKNRKLVDREVLGYVVRRCEHCKTMCTATVFADATEKPLSERNVKIKYACDGLATSPLIIAALATRVLALEENQVERNEDSVLYRRGSKPQPTHSIRRLLGKQQRLKL